MQLTAVIGAGFGDETKGKHVDYFSTPKTMVVRFNGGAQASHTVVRDGRRHIFRHFGSGTLQGATTFLSKYFISNPILYFKELDLLKKIGCEPLVYADPEGMVTTPWDMMINTILEESRGISRHGSCGVGINETMQRHVKMPFQIFHLRNYAASAMCQMIMAEWVPERLGQLNLSPSHEWMERLMSRDILANFIEDCDLYFKSVRGSFMSRVLIDEKIEHIVFEGAQGLLLDQDHRFFPYVTHSKTGIHNVLRIIEQDDIHGDLDVTYVTRAYATRHGAGPFPREQPELRHQDETNMPNDWQGTLRFGHLDLNLLAETITHDMLAIPDIETRLAVSCLDQVGDVVQFWEDDELRRAAPREMIERACTRIAVKKCLTSGGPNVNDITEFAI